MFTNLKNNSQTITRYIINKIKYENYNYQQQMMF